MTCVAVPQCMSLKGSYQRYNDCEDLVSMLSMLIRWLTTVPGFANEVKVVSAERVGINIDRSTSYFYVCLTTIRLQSIAYNIVVVICFPVASQLRYYE